MFIISVLCSDGKKRFYSRKFLDGVSLVTCKLSARRYKTFKGCLTSYLDLMDTYGFTGADLEILDITELCKYE